MTTSKRITSAILLALIGIVAIAAIDPIAGEMMNSGKMMQPMMSSCPAGMNCMAMMPMNAANAAMKPMMNACPANMTCMMMVPMMVMMPMNASGMIAQSQMSMKMMPMNVMNATGTNTSMMVMVPMGMTMNKSMTIVMPTNASGMMPMMSMMSSQNRYMIAMGKA